MGEDAYAMTYHRTVSARGEITIPAEVRRELGIRAGQLLSVKVEGRSLVMRPLPDDIVAAFRGRFADGPSLTEALVREHAEELRRDEARLRPKT